MFALDFMLAAAAQAAVSAPAQGTSPAPLPNVEVVGPAAQNRVICRTLTPSGSHIAARRVCQTVAQIEAARSRAQQEGGLDVRAADRRTNEMLQQSSGGNYVRAHPELNPRPF